MLCGLDEAGRGPLAGPVCAAAVILPEDFPVEILDDSKKLSESKREAARVVIFNKAAAWGVGWAAAFEIDEINILRASLLAMRRAYDEMIRCAEAAGRPLPPVTAIVDGLYTPDIPCPCRAEVKADARFPCVMAASILAKTCRDRMMVRYSWLYPEYGYEGHKGYPTKAHRQVVLRRGPSPIQRLTFTVKK